MKAKINGYEVDGVQSVTLRDFLSGKLDECEVEIIDSGGWKWFSGYRPKKGDKIELEVIQNGEKVSLGTFVLQSWRQRVGSVTLTCQSANIAASTLRAVRSTVYTNTTLRGIVSAIAQRNGLTLYFDGEDQRPADFIRQNRQTDLSFLMDLGNCCGFWVKLWNSTLIFRSKHYAANLENQSDGSVLGKVAACSSRVTLTPADLLDFGLEHKGDVPDKAKWKFYKPIDAFLDNAESGAGFKTVNNLMNPEPVAKRVSGALVTAGAASVGGGAFGPVLASAIAGGQPSALVDKGSGAGVVPVAAGVASQAAGGGAWSLAAAVAARVGVDAGLGRLPVVVGFPGVSVAGDVALEALLSAAEVSCEMFGRADLAAGSIFNLSSFGDYDGVYLVSEMIQTWNDGGKWRSRLTCRRVTAEKFTGSGTSQGKSAAGENAAARMEKTKALAALIEAEQQTAKLKI